MPTVAGNLDMVQIWLQAFLQLVTSRMYPGTEGSIGMVQLSLQRWTSSAAAMSSVIGRSLCQDLESFRYEEAQCTGLLSSMHRTQTWKRAPTLPNAQPTAMSELCKHSSGRCTPGCRQVAMQKVPVHLLAAFCPLPLSGVPAAGATTELAAV